MKEQLLRSPCYSCIRFDENKNECSLHCDKLKEYQESLRSTHYEDLKGSVFEIYTSLSGHDSIRVHG